MNHNILIVHGWLHSAKRYEKLKEKLEKENLCNVTLYEFSGFGDTSPKKYSNLLKYYAEELAIEIERGNYDYAIGHSMGGNVLLRAMANKQLKTKLILLSPEYAGITLLKPLLFIFPIIPIIFVILKNIKCSITTFLIKCMALFTINNWKKIDNQIVVDTRKASVIVAVVSMMELAWDNWRVTNEEWNGGNISIIIGENDRIISKKKIRMLHRDLKNSRVYCIKHIGHTAVLENFDKLCNILLEIMYSNV